MASEKTAQTVFQEAYSEYEARHLDDCIWRFSRTVMPYCGSEIEKMLGAALYFANISGLQGPQALLPGDMFKDPSNTELARLTWHRALLVPQARILNYRADFGLFVYHNSDVLKLAIECDGHDFHEKTKQQAAHDKQRDRKITAEGYRMFRFTGSEVFRDPLGCAAEVAQVASDWILTGYQNDSGK